MEKFNEIILFPHIKLTEPQQALLSAICHRADLLVPDGRIDNLAQLVKPCTLGKAASEKVRQSYRDIRQFSEEVMAQGARPGDYAGGNTSTAPVYDRETPLRILSDFRADDQPAGWEGMGKQALSAAVTLLFAEDVLALQAEAQAMLADTAPRAETMWRELKGGSDPLQPGEDSAPSVPDSQLMKKRLTAWSILARMLLLTDTSVWLTFEKPVSELCLSAFALEEPFKEITLDKARAVFYKLPLSPVAFAAWLADTDAQFAVDDGAGMTLCFVDVD